MSYRIFMSHSAEDADWIKWISSNVRLLNIDTYLFEHDIQPGNPVADKIQGAIRNCDSMVVFLTVNSRFSPYVQQEIGYAEAFRKPIIPLVQRGLEERSLAMLSGREYIPFDYKNPTASLSKLTIHLQKQKQTKEVGEALTGLVLLAALGWALSKMGEIK